MILKANEIANRLDASLGEAERLIIRPQPAVDKLKESGAGSIDLRLGTWFQALPRSRVTHLDIVDDPQSALNYANFARHYHVPFSKKFILHPKDFVLGVTLEWIRLPGNLAGYVVGRSSWGRRGLIIATAAGVHPGFTGCLTLELTNVGEIPIALEPGMPICQLFLHETKGKTEIAHSSRYIGLRRPAVGDVELDEVAKALARRETT
jgi:dCTP deaminase